MHVFRESLYTSFLALKTAEELESNLNLNEEKKQLRNAVYSVWLLTVLRMDAMSKQKGGKAEVLESIYEKGN